MEDKSKIKKKYNKLTNRYRLVIMNEDSFEEVSAFNLSRLNIYLILSSIFVVITAIVCSIIIFTPVKEYLPGYEGLKLKKEVIDMKMVLDSLDHELKISDQYYKGIKFALTDGRDSSYLSSNLEDVNVDTSDLLEVSEKDLEIRDKVEKEIKYRLFSHSEGNELPHFIVPVQGMVSSVFDPEQQHFGIDVVAPEKSIIKSIYTGKVIFSGWTIDFGNVIIVQHKDEYISIYMHNSQLLKKNGSFVKSGDPIAFIGNTGEKSSGTHLHFELWYKGEAVNPEEYMNFK